MSMAARKYCSHCNAAFASDIDKCPRDGADLALRATNPLLGQILGGRYRLIERLGAGGMGEVYRAEHITIGKSFAIKVLLGEVAADNSMVARFHREAQALSRLSHRNVVSVADFGETDQGLLYLVTEFVDGTLLSDAVKQGSFDHKRVVHIVKQIGKALSHAHRRGLVHRDLKPDNIMLVQTDDEKDVVKVLDFGLARVAEADDESRESDHRLTTQGIVMGTPAYISPEQALGSLADHRADLYSLGIVLYELLSGTVPFVGKNPIDLMSQHLRTPPPPINRHGVSGEFKALTMRLLEKDPKNRYQDADSFLTELDSLREPAPASLEVSASSDKAAWAAADTIDSSADTLDGRPDDWSKSDTIAAPTSDVLEEAEAALQASATERAEAPELDTSAKKRPVRRLAVVVGLLGLGAAAASLAFVYLVGGDEKGQNQRAATAPVRDASFDAPLLADASSPSPSFVPKGRAVIVEVDAGAMAGTTDAAPEEPKPKLREPKVRTPKSGGRTNAAPTLEALHESVERAGKALDKLAESADASAVDSLRSRWADLATSLPGLDDSPESRKTFDAKLRRLSRAIKNAGDAK